MTNPYNANQQWSQDQLQFGPQQVNQEYEPGAPDDRQQHFDQQSYGSLDPSYQYAQQQLPPNPASNSSSLHGVFAISQQSQSHATSYGTAQGAQNMAGGYVHGVYGVQQSGPSSGSNRSGAPYRTPPTTFNFSSVGAGSVSMQGNGVNPVSTNTTSSFLTSAPLHESLPQASTSTLPVSYYPVTSDDRKQPLSKRHHGLAFKDDSNQEDQDADSSQEQKDANKSKLSRACARCKNLKVRCEAKTETEPCKRCFNGGHECVIPGRKIRRTPPKREHLLNQIHTQAQEIDRLMQELQKASGTSSKQGAKRNSDQDDDGHSHSPVLSPSSTSGSYYSSEAAQTMQYSNIDGSYNSQNTANTTTAGNKAVEEWIAKARESLHEFGAFIGIGGAGMPKSYLVDEDFEDSESDEEDFVDVQEDLEGFANGDEHYELAVEDPEGDEMAVADANAQQQRGMLRHKSSNSSVGTIGTAGTTALPRPKKNSNDNAKSASLPVEASPFGLFGNLSLKSNPKSRSGSVEPEDEDKGPGIANENFFKSTPAPNALGRRLESAQHQASTILTRGIITPQEAEILFKIYFDNMNLSVSLLDPVLYTAQRTFYRSPFLFTVICAIASRFYSERPDLYAKIMQQAQHAAGMALISGSKNVEMCQAYILLSLYPVPARKWEDQRSWLYLGLAIRTATDLNLHLPTTAKPLNENHAREMLNRTRVWINCLNLDRSTGSQYGKPPIISPRDYIANHSDRWWATSQYNMKNFDIHISAYNSELKVMAAFIAKIYSDPDHPTGLNRDVDFEGIATETDDQLKALGDKWFTELEQTDMSDPQNSFRTGLLRLAYSYSRLVALSYGFQHAFGKTDGVDENPFLIRCLRAASDVVDAVVNDICRPSQLHYFRHGPEAQSVFVTFASAFLVKLLQPKFASYLTPETRVEIRNLVQQVINLLGSPEIAIDDRHGPKLYSRFLAKLLARPMARLDTLSPGSAASANSALPRVKTRPVKSSPAQAPNFDSSTFEIPTAIYNHPSPETSTSLSPPPTEAALSFDTFAPVGPTDPFATETAATVAASNASASNINNMMIEGFFQPALPFDDHIVQSLQSLTDPSGWQDISLPGFNWMTQFQQNLGLDLNNSSVMYDQNMDYYNDPVNGSG